MTDANSETFITVLIGRASKFARPSVDRDLIIIV